MTAIEDTPTADAEPGERLTKEAAESLLQQVLANAPAKPTEMEDLLTLIEDIDRLIDRQEGMTERDEGTIGGQDRFADETVDALREALHILRQDDHIVFAQQAEDRANLQGLIERLSASEKPDALESHLDECLEELREWASNWGNTETAEWCQERLAELSSIRNSK